MVSPPLPRGLLLFWHMKLTNLQYRLSVVLALVATAGIMWATVAADAATAREHKRCHHVTQAPSFRPEKQGKCAVQRALDTPSSAQVSDHVALIGDAEICVTLVDGFTSDLDDHVAMSSPTGNGLMEPAASRHTTVPVLLMQKPYYGLHCVASPRAPPV